MRTWCFIWGWLPARAEDEYVKGSLQSKMEALLGHSKADMIAADLYFSLEPWYLNCTEVEPMC